MLDTLVSTGMPKDLFLPTIHFTIDNKLLAQAKARGFEYPDKAMIKKASSNEENGPLSKSGEKYARELFNETSASYNSVVKSKDILHMKDYYKLIHKKWDNQISSQQSKLEDPEIADCRWEQYSTLGDDVFQGWWILEALGDEDDFNDYESSDSEDSGIVHQPIRYADSDSDEQLDEE